MLSPQNETAFKTNIDKRAIENAEQELFATRKQEIRRKIDQEKLNIRTAMERLKQEKLKTAAIEKSLRDVMAGRI